ncbi:MAG: DinB family protein [Weeksellaceae bacterium]|nr:DinB family protein [Weeksellaceae bacterium]
MNIQAYEFESHRILRGKLAAYLDHYSHQRLTDIPYGHRNHIFWNIAHVLVTQQLLCYYLADRPMQVSAELVQRYKKGTVPDPQADISRDLQEVKSLIHSTANRLQEDHIAGNFTDYQQYATSFGITLHNAQEAFRFNLMHETLHLGTILSISKLV